jgi:hypothetical protein
MKTKQTRVERVQIDTRPKRRAQLGRPKLQAIDAALNVTAFEQRSLAKILTRSGLSYIHHSQRRTSSK